MISACGRVLRSLRGAFVGADQRVGEGEPGQVELRDPCGGDEPQSRAGRPGLRMTSSVVRGVSRISRPRGRPGQGCRRPSLSLGR